jgi:TRAP-type C4-dicarboxylate transport system substrate-binding protein
MRKVIVLAGAVAAVSGATAVSPAANAETVFAFSNWIPWTHKLSTRLYIPWMEEIEKKTQGRVKFRKLPKAVAHPRAHMDAVRTGQADAAFGVQGYSPRRLRAYLFTDFPLLGESAVATSVAFQRTYEKFLKGKGHYAGVHIIGMNTHGPGVIHHASRIIKTTADMKGQKIRTGGPVPRRIIETWGGISIRQPAPKSYELLSTGVVVGVTFPYEALTGFKIVNLVKYHTELPGGLYCSGFYTMISKKKYDALSAADRKVIDDLSGEAFALRAGKVWDQNDADGKAAAIKGKHTFSKAGPQILASVKKIKAQLEKDYIADMKKQGIDGAAVLQYFYGELAKVQAANK